MKRLIKRRANEESFKCWYILPIEDGYARSLGQLSIEEKKDIIVKYRDDYEGKEWIAIYGDYGYIVSDGESVRYSERMPTNEGFRFKNKDYDGSGNEMEDFLNDKKESIPNIWYACSYDELMNIAGEVVGKMVEEYKKVISKD